MRYVASTKDMLQDTQTGNGDEIHIWAQTVKTLFSI